MVVMRGMKGGRRWDESGVRVLCFAGVWAFDAHNPKISPFRLDADSADHSLNSRRSHGDRSTAIDHIHSSAPTTAAAATAAAATAAARPAALTVSLRPSHSAPTVLYVWLCTHCSHSFASVSALL